MDTHILDLLSNDGYISKNDVALLNGFIEKWQVTPFRAILKTHLLSEFLLAEALAEILKIEHIYTIRTEDIDPKAVEKIPYFKALEWSAMPLGKKSGNEFRVVMADPTSEEIKKHIRELVGENVIFSVSVARNIMLAIDEVYPIERQMPALSGHQGGGA